jgi:hypothetical protein
MNISELSESKYLKKEDMPLEVQITGLSKENLAKEGEPAEHKYILHFNGNVKPLVLNVTNAQLIGHQYGEETDNWIGHTISLYNDPSVSFAGKLTGGIRVKLPNPDDF